MKKVLNMLVIALLATGSAQAADIAAGKAKAATCSGCHGSNGIGIMDTYPNLAGQKAGYLAKQLKDFKSGKRADPIMGSMAKPLSDADIANISAYYASLK